MKTFSQFTEDVDISRLSDEKKAAARAQAANDGIPIKDDKDKSSRRTRDERKKLPGTAAGGALAGGALAKRDISALTKPADKGTAIVKAKQNKSSASKPDTPVVSAPDTPKGGERFGRKVPGGWGKTFGKDDNKLKKKPKKKKRKDMFGGAKSWLKDNIKDDSKELGTGEGKVSGPQMGIYNPK